MVAMIRLTQNGEKVFWRRTLILDYKIFSLPLTFPASLVQVLCSAHRKPAERI